MHMYLVQMGKLASNHHPQRLNPRPQILTFLPTYAIASFPTCNINAFVLIAVHSPLSSLAHGT